MKKKRRSKWDVLKIGDYYYSRRLVEEYLCLCKRLKYSTTIDSDGIMTIKHESGQARFFSLQTRRKDAPEFAIGDLSRPLNLKTEGAYNDL